MKNLYRIAACLVLVSLCTGCVLKYPNPDITVSSTGLEDITPVAVGSFDIYTADFRIENPTNTSFKNVEVRINLVPLLSYCHAQSKTVGIPVFYPAEKRTVPFSVAEFSDLGCQYTYTYTVVSENAP
jgi:hypothetical protein